MVLGGRSKESRRCFLWSAEGLGKCCCCCLLPAYAGGFFGGRASVGVMWWEGGGKGSVHRVQSLEPVTRPRPNRAGAWGMRPGRRRGQERGTLRPSFDDNSAPARLNLDSGAFGVRGRGARGVCTRDSRAAHRPPAGPHAPARPWGGLCRGGKGWDQAPARKNKRAPTRYGVAARVSTSPSAPKKKGRVRESDDLGGV